MFQVIRAKDRFHTQNDWLSTYWLFSFGHYYDPKNISFSALRVFNDDVVQPGAGFPTHSHGEMEIVTYVLDGALEHHDSTGGHGLINAGEVQRMTAGTGVAHSEFNASNKDNVHLMQIWVLPNERGLKPSYEQLQFTKEQRAGKLLPIASGRNLANTVKVHQDVTFYVSTVRPEDKLTHELKNGRRAFLYVIDGELNVNGETLSKGDQARIGDEHKLSFTTEGQGEIILIDLP